MLTSLKHKTLTTPQLMTYNAFGYISITPKRITVSITAIDTESGKSFTRSTAKEIGSAIPNLPHAVATFGAWLEKNKRARITVNELGETKLKMPI